MQTQIAWHMLFSVMHKCIYVFFLTNFQMSSCFGWTFTFSWILLLGDGGLKVQSLPHRHCISNCVTNQHAGGEQCLLVSALCTYIYKVSHSCHATACVCACVSLSKRGYPFRYQVMEQKIWPATFKTLPSQKTVYLLSAHFSWNKQPGRTSCNSTHSKLWKHCEDTLWQSGGKLTGALKNDQNAPLV